MRSVRVPIQILRKGRSTAQASVLPSAPASLHVLQANSTALYSLRLATYASCRTSVASSSWHRMVISEKSPFLDPLVMNSSTTTGGRWCPPASNAETFMSSSPSYCAGASPGMWGGQGKVFLSPEPSARPTINCKLCFGQKFMSIHCAGVSFRAVIISRSNSTV